MMVKLAVLALSLAACAAPTQTAPPPSAPAPAPAPAPTAAACAATGEVLFEIDQQTKLKDGDTRDTKLYANGAWVVAATAGEAAPPPDRTGCLPAAALADVTARIAAAPWTVSHPRIHCDIYATTYTVFSIHGKPLFRKETCGPDEIDAESARQLEAILATITAATTGTSP